MKRCSGGGAAAASLPSAPSSSAAASGGAVPTPLLPPPAPIAILGAGDAASRFGHRGRGGSGAGTPGGLNDTASP